MTVSLGALSPRNASRIDGTGNYMLALGLLLALVRLLIVTDAHSLEATARPGVLLGLDDNAALTPAEARTSGEVAAVAPHAREGRGNAALKLCHRERNGRNESDKPFLYLSEDYIRGTELKAVVHAIL